MLYVNCNEIYFGYLTVYKVCSKSIKKEAIFTKIELNNE